MTEFYEVGRLHPDFTIPFAAGKYPLRVRIWLKKALGIPSESEREYAQPARLADVMALIQVLALDPKAHRTEDGVKHELQRQPGSDGADTWTSLARAHPEFFRVNPRDEYPISLIARHVHPVKEDDKREALTADFVGNLLRSAVDIHDRQVRRSERWSYLVPIWGALILGISGLVTALLGLLG
jgi:hypothetical protein